MNYIKEDITIDYFSKKVRNLELIHHLNNTTHALYLQHLPEWSKN